MGDQELTEEAYTELPTSTIKEDVNLNRATRFPGDVFWRLSKYLNGSQGKSSDDDPKKKSVKWPIILVAIPVALAIAAAVVLGLGVPYLKNSKLKLVEGEDIYVNISDPAYRAYIINLPQRDSRNLPNSIVKPDEFFKDENSVKGTLLNVDGSSIVSQPTLASMFSFSSIINKHKALRKSRNSYAAEFEITGGNRYFMCLDQVPKASYRHLARHLCGGSYNGTIHSVYGTPYSLVTKNSKQAAQGVYECTSPVACTIKACPGGTCTCTEVISVTCVLNSTPLPRIIDGRYREEGLLQLYVEDQWGYVCVDNYMRGANHVCNALGYGCALARFTEVADRQCQVPLGMGHHGISINCPTTATSLSHCFFDSQECTGKYVWLQCEPKAQVYPNIHRSLSYTPNSVYKFPAKSYSTLSPDGCDFEANMCSWTQDTTDDFDWFRHQGPNTTVNTASSCAPRNQKENRWYMHFDASSPRWTSKVARIKSGTFSPTGKCLRFLYNIHGDAEGSLKVKQVNTSGHEVILWSLSSAFGNNWRTGYSLLDYTIGSSYLLIEATRGLGVRSDFSVDEIEISSAVCRTGSTNSCPFMYQLASCVNNRCFSNGGLCNNYQECGTNKDEQGCTQLANTFKCTSEDTFIPFIYKCDGRASCSAAEDEAGCPPCQTAIGEVFCGNNICYQPIQQCDGVNNCGNWADERNCPASSCAFVCSDSTCLPSASLLCDGNSDCSDDETNCNFDMAFPTSSIPGYVVTGGAQDPTGGFKPLIQDSSSYTNGVFKPSTIGQYAYLTSPATAVPTISCLSFKHAGFSNLTSAIYVQVTTLKNGVSNTWYPMQLNPAPVSGVWKEARMQLKVPYSAGCNIKVKFGILNAYIDDIAITTTSCASSPTLQPTNQHGNPLPVTTVSPVGSTCSFATDYCNLNSTGFLNFGSGPHWNRLVLTNDRASGRLQFYFDSQSVTVTVSNENFTQAMVNAVCVMRGYSIGKMAVTQMFQAGTGSCIKQLFCPPDLENIFECFYEAILPAAQCDHSKDMGIVCSDSLFSDSDIAQLSNLDFISTDGRRSASVLTNKVHSSAKCVEFSYKMPLGKWIYAGGVAPEAVAPYSIQPTKGYGSLFNNLTETGEWKKVQAPLVGTEMFILIAMSHPSSTIQISNLTFLSTDCTIPHEYDNTTQLTCKTVRQSFPILKQCDGFVDCVDGSDEDPQVCTKSLLCDRVVPPSQKKCSEYTYHGADRLKPCNSTCSHPEVPHPAGHVFGPWCHTGDPAATTATSGWGVCNTDQSLFLGNNAFGSMSHPIWYFGNVKRYGCITDNHVRPWGSPHIVFEWHHQWGNCAGCQLLTKPRTTTNGGVCHFPFVYNTVVYSTCIMRDSHAFWCSLTESYDLHRQWGFCGETVQPANQPKCRERTIWGTMNGKRCHYPFKFQGVEYSHSILDSNSGRLWCSGTYEYQALWGVSIGCPLMDPFWVRTIAAFGTGPGRQCSFPFFFDGGWFYDCTFYKSPAGAWCATQHLPGSGQGWGYCGDFTTQPFTRHPICLDSAKRFDDDETLMGGTQTASNPIKWRHTFNVTKTQKTSPRMSANRRTFQDFRHAHLQEVFGKPIDTYTPNSPGGYIYADMSDPALPAGSLGSIRFVTGIGAACLRACYHMVGRHVGQLHISVNDAAAVWQLEGEQVDPRSSSSPYYPADQWRCFEYQPGVWFSSVTFLAYKGYGEEGDIAIDEIHFLEDCYLHTYVQPEGEFNCGGDLVIPQSQVCDCHRNCPSGNDEVNCADRYVACTAGQFACGNGCCIDLEKKCDGHQHCANNADELACPTTTRPTSTPMPSPLTVTAGGETYAPNERCNEIIDVTSGDDEKGCMCTSSQFSCSGTCINKGRLCDGTKDCFYNEDEPTTCPPCPFNQFTCDNGECIDLAGLCNGTLECTDKTDEPAHQCGKACPLSMSNLPSKYSGLVVGTPPSTLGYGQSYTLQLTCAGVWWSNKTSYDMYRWFTYECRVSGSTVGPSADMDLVCIPPIPAGLLPFGPLHLTDPVNFMGLEFVDLPLKFSPQGNPGYIQIKGKQVTTFRLGKTGFVSHTPIPTGASSPFNYKFLNAQNLRFRDVFSVLSIDVDPNNPGWVFFDQFSAAHADPFLEHLANATCAPVNLCGSYTPPYGALFTFFNVRDKSGNVHNAQLAFTATSALTVALFNYVTHPGTNSANELGMLLTTADLMKLNKIATSGNLLQHSTHGTNGHYLEEIFAFVTKYKGDTLLPYSTQTDQDVLLRTFTDPIFNHTFSSPTLRVFDYLFDEVAISPHGRVMFGTSGTTTYETNKGCIASTLPNELAILTGINTRMSPASSSGRLYYRYTTDATDLAKVKMEVNAAQTLIPNWTPTYAVVITWQGSMIDDGSVDLEGFGNTFQIIMASDGSTSFGLVHYALMLEYWDYSSQDCLGPLGGSLKPGFTRELRRGVPNNNITYFEAQASHNASTLGVYVVLMDGFPCPISSTPTNFTLRAGYPDPLWTTDSHSFWFVCNGGRGSPFDWENGNPGPGRVLNPHSFTCTPQKQGLPIDFDSVIAWAECRKRVYFFGSELGQARIPDASFSLVGSTKYVTVPLNPALPVKGSGITAMTITSTGAVSMPGASGQVINQAYCLQLRDKALSPMQHFFALFNLQFTTGQYYPFFSYLVPAPTNPVVTEFFTRGKSDVCHHLGQAVASCVFNPTGAVTLTIYDSSTASTIAPSAKVTGQLVFLTNGSDTYVLFIYEHFTDVTPTPASICPFEIGMILRSADDLKISKTGTVAGSNFGRSGTYIAQIGTFNTNTCPTKFYTPIPSNIAAKRRINSAIGTYTLTGGPLNLFGYTFTSFFFGPQGALMFGGTDGTSCLNAPITDAGVKVYISLLNQPMSVPGSPGDFWVGDTTDTAVINHYKPRVCAAHPGVCPAFGPNRVVIVTVKGIDMDTTGDYFAATWQAVILTNGTKSYLVASYGIIAGFNKQGPCLEWRGATVNNNFTRNIDVNTSSTAVTATNIYDTQNNTNTGETGTYSVSLCGYNCSVATWVPPGFMGMSTFPTIMTINSTFNQTFTCTGGFGIPFDNTAGLSNGGGLVMNHQLLNCTPELQATQIGFSTSDSYPTDLTRFICYPFYHSASEAGTAKIPDAAFVQTGNAVYVAKSLSSPIIIKGQSFSSMRISKFGSITFSSYSHASVTPSSAFSFYKYSGAMFEMAPIFSVISGPTDGGGVFFDQYSRGNNAKYNAALDSMQQLVNSNVAGVSGFEATYAALVTYIQFSAPTQYRRRRKRLIIVVQKTSAQITFVTNGTESFAIFKYAESSMSPGSGANLHELGMMAQSTDVFDIWSIVGAGAITTSGNAGAGTYVVRIGERKVYNTFPGIFMPFGTGNGDTAYNMSLHSNGVDINLTDAFRIHDYNYNRVRIDVDGIVTFGFQNKSIPSTAKCTGYNPANLDYQLTYIGLVNSDFTGHNSYGLVYFRNVPITTPITDNNINSALGTMASGGAAALAGTAQRMIVITYHGSRFNSKEAGASFQLVLITDGDDTSGLINIGLVVEWDHLTCRGWMGDVVNKNKTRIVANPIDVNVLRNEVLADGRIPIDFDGHVCIVDTNVGVILPFTLTTGLPPNVPTDKNYTYDVQCTNGFIFDYKTGYNTSGRNINGPPQTQAITCPPYVQGTSRSLPLIKQWACLQTMYPCCNGGNTPSLNVSNFQRGFMRQSVTMSQGFKYAGSKEDYVIVGDTGFVTLEAEILQSTSTLKSPSCVNKSMPEMTRYLNYFSILGGKEFNYSMNLDGAGGGGIFFEEVNVQANPSIVSLVVSDTSHTPTHIILVSYIGVINNITGNRQNAQLAIAYSGTKTFAITLHDDFDIVDEPNCAHDILIATKLADRLLNSPTEDGCTSKRMGLVCMLEKREFKTTWRGGSNLFNYSTSDKYVFVYKPNDPSSPITDDSTNTISVSSLFSNTISTFNTFDHQYTHIGLAAGVIYFGSLATPDLVWPTAYCIKNNTGFKNMTYVSLMSHDQNPVISPGAMYVQPLTSPDSSLDQCASLVKTYNTSAALTGFSPTYGLIVTWQGLTGIDGEDYANTYQAVFCSNGTLTYVIMIYGIITDYDGPDCFEWAGVGNDNHTYRFIHSGFNSSRKIYFYNQHSSNCPSCPDNDGMFILSVDGFTCHWDKVMLGNFQPQPGCCSQSVETTESITIAHTCMNGYIHPYTGTGQSPGATTLTCTPQNQGYTLRLNETISNFNYYCESNLFDCCYSQGAGAFPSSIFTNGWYQISLAINIPIKGTMESKLMLSETGFLFFNDTASLTAPKCYNFLSLANRPFLHAFSLFSDQLTIGSNTANSASGRLFIQQYVGASNIPSAIKMTVPALTSPTFAILISFIEAPNADGKRQSGQIAFITNGTHTYSIFKYQKNTSGTSCQIGVMMKSSETMNIRNVAKAANQSIDASTFVMEVGQKQANANQTLKPDNMLKFGAAQGDMVINYDQDQMKQPLNDDRDYSIALSTPIDMWGRTANVISLTDNGYISFGDTGVPQPDQFCVKVGEGYPNIVYLMAMNYDFKPESSYGKAYYRDSQNADDLKIVKDYVCNNTFGYNCSQTGFAPSRILVVTHHGLVAIDDPTFGNTFQFIVATDGNLKHTFGIVVYGVTLSYQGDNNCEQWRGTTPDRSTYVYIDGSSNFNHLAIYTSQMRTSTNVAGVWPVKMMP